MLVTVPVAVTTQVQYSTLGKCESGGTNATWTVQEEVQGGQATQRLTRP